ncbi:MazG family protein [Brooklawnia sp.]|uniref:MazG family protein n=1 Tax=Brooklawnia sp. TaxID=2699740 RepID=UPI00312001DA
MRRLRAECPWDAQQTHRSLVKHLIEEAAEVTDAIETEPVSDADLREELGDLLMQVYFHAEIARTQNRFDIEDIARGICDKLVARHPWVFGGEDDPDDLDGAWERAKQAEKQRSSVLEGVPDSLSALARTMKVVSRSRAMHLDVAMADDPISADEVGQQIIALVQRAQACGVDPDQAARGALRALEDQVHESEL